MDPKFVPPEYIAGMPVGPLSPFIEAYIALVKEQGYLPCSVHRQVRVIGRFSQWLHRTRRDIHGLNASMVGQFFRQGLGKRRLHSCDPATLRRLLAMLRQTGAVVVAEKSLRLNPSQELIDRYRRFLIEERALSQETVRSYVRYIGGFLANRFGAGGMRLSKLRASDLTDYVQRNAPCHSADWARILVAALRTFLRYLRYQGLIEADLAAAVPNVASWSLSGLPKHIPAAAVRRVLDRCDQTTRLGQRNYAILLLMARLGLRAGEVVRLKLDDMDWINAQVTVHGKGRRWSRMPLPADVGRAVAQYLRRSRPRCSCRRVFIRDDAPHVGFSRSNAISYIARSALNTAGVKSPRTGAHLFRHSLATNMLRHGASLEEIGQLLRHKSPDSTAIYAKVEVAALRPLAMRWPGGGR